MAVTAFSKGYKMTATGDSLNQATVGNANDPANGRFICRVSSIELTSTAGATIQLSGDGVVFFKGVVAANDTAQVGFSAPQDIADLTYTANSAGAGDAIITVHIQ